jgi:hypothetical protein
MWVVIIGVIVYLGDVSNRLETLSILIWDLADLNPEFRLHHLAEWC